MTLSHVLIAAACLGTVAFAQQFTPPPQPPPELGKLAVYLGEWKVEGENKPSPLGPAGKVPGRATGTMVLRGFFLEWRWEDQGPMGISRGFEMLGYSPVTKNFPSTLFGDDGGLTWGEYALAGNRSTFVGKVLAGGKEYELRATEVFAGDGRSFTRTADVSVDGNTWIPCYEGRFTRVQTAVARESPAPTRPAPAPNVEEGFFPGADGVRLFYRRVGTGPETVVYLHGGPTSMADGGYELDALAEGRTLIAFDQRSGGRSQLVHDRSLLSADHFIRDLEALQRHFGLKRVTLIGQSWGALLAAMYTARHPDSVNRLLLLSPGSPSRLYHRDRIRAIQSVLGAEAVKRIAEIGKELTSAPDERVAALCAERTRIQFRAYLHDPAALERMRVPYWEGTPEALRHQDVASSAVYSSMGEYDVLPVLAKLPQPALVVEGIDTKVPLAATRAWAAALPNGRILLVPGVSHIVWLEGDVSALMRTLNQFLAGKWPERAERIATDPSRIGSP